MIVIPLHDYSTLILSDEMAFRNPAVLNNKFSRKLIAKKKKEIALFFSKGKKFSSSFFILFLLSTEYQSFPKVFFAVSKKVNRACQRNLIKRRMREIFRQHPFFKLSPFAFGWIAKEKALKAPFEELKTDMIKLGEKAMQGDKLKI
ncbi:ribonuclease P protein component [Candidatus Methylacidiphilum infernorum]|uniref:Ribonuclease P protein component n=1 Tax=Methylacidiphilum infernorum (isolate V4) TaxID=481448 RepID=B3DUH6_METI4|nr:ribonuclease P protein component [Candidatus Methylacidiphilum infernorum]ACD82979.1 Ribonuclease P protein component [Methylacidiphilum infernorum V4]